MSEMIHLHPLVFTLQDAITGCGFLASILVTGKAVMENEDGKWWMYGVCPGALAGCGATPQEAFADFRKRYKETLIDMAEEFSSFLLFRKAVQEFFDQEDHQESARWEEALRILRQNDKAVAEPFKAVPRKKPGEYTLGVNIERLSKKKQSTLTPADNIQDCVAKVA